MGFVVIVPARMSSSRLKEKPLADICGKPMVVRTAERALRCRIKYMYPRGRSYNFMLSK